MKETILKEDHCVSASVKEPILNHCISASMKGPILKEDHCKSISVKIHILKDDHCISASVKGSKLEEKSPILNSNWSILRCTKEKLTSTKFSQLLHIVICFDSTRRKRDNTEKTQAGERLVPGKTFQN